MSYILDALKKSEQEHKKGQVPGLGTVQGLPGPGGRFETDRLIWMYGLATILVAALGVGTWLFLREPTPAPVEAPPVAIAQLPADINAAVPAKAEAKPAAAPPTPKPSRPTAPQPPTARTTSPQLLKEVVRTPTAPTSPFAPVAPVSPMVEKAQSPPAQVAETVPERPTVDESANEESETTPVKPELLPTVPFEELPAETKAEMPPIKIGLHLFSDTPASRRASINGRLVREGQTVDKDLVLVEIIRQGVILSYQGRKFTMPVFPR